MSHSHVYALSWKRSPGVSAPLVDDNEVPAVLEAIRRRRSVFPRDYTYGSVSKNIVVSMVDAAMWAPFHGSRPPWRFVVLGKQAMVEMQKLTLNFYGTTLGSDMIHARCASHSN